MDPVGEVDRSEGEAKFGVELGECLHGSAKKLARVGGGSCIELGKASRGGRFGKGKTLDAILNSRLGNGVDPMDDRDFGGFNDFGVGATCFYDCENDENVRFDEHDKEFSESGGLGRLLMKNGFAHLVAKSHDAATRSRVGIEFGSKIEERCSGESSVVRGRQIVLGLRAACFENATVPLDHGPSICDADSLKDVLALCGAPKEIELLKPSLLQRPWTPPEGYICLYEAYFTHCGLMFPLPEFLAEYCSRRNIAISQLTIGAIRNAVGLAILGAECGVEIDADFLEEATKFAKVGDSPGSYYASAKANYKIVYGATSKVHGWQRRYFFVKLSEFSVENPNTLYVADWVMSPGRFYLVVVSRG